MELLPSEIWRDIKNYEGLYQVSSQSRIRSVTHTANSNNGKSDYTRNCEGKTLKQVLDNGYHRVTLCKNGKRTNYNVHRIVAETFIPNPNNYPEVDHIIPVINGGTDSVNNLRWVTKKMNANNYKSVKNRSEAQLKVSEQKSKKMTGKCYIHILQYDSSGKLVNTFTGMEQCESQGYHYHTIKNSIVRKAKAYGFTCEIKRIA